MGIFVSPQALFEYVQDVAAKLPGWTVERLHEHGHYLVGPGDLKLFIQDLSMGSSRAADRGKLEVTISYQHIPGHREVYPAPARAKFRITATRGPLQVAKAISAKLLLVAEGEVARIKADRSADEQAQRARQAVVEQVRLIGQVTGRIVSVTNGLEDNRAVVSLASQKDTDAPSGDVEVRYRAETMKLELTGPTDKILAALKVLYANGVDLDELYGTRLV